MRFPGKEKSTAFNLSGQFMLAFLTLSAFFAGFAVHKCKTTGPTPSDIRSLTEGEWSMLYEEAFNKSLETYDPSKNGWGILSYAVFREGNNGVLIGEDNWLFSTEEFSLQSDWERNYRYNVDFILAVRDYLKASQTELIIVPVPAKARIYEDKLGRYDYPVYKEGIYGSFISDMKGSGIAVVNLLPAFQEEKTDESLFVKSDTHWSPVGSRLAAQSVGAYIHRNYPESLYEKTAFVTHVEGETLHQGDLSRYVPLGPFSDDFGISGDLLRKVETVKADEGQADLASALFSDATPPITLVGTSYSANPVWNFEGFLKESLGSDILNAADEGLGPFETMKKYLGNEAFRNAPPRVIIWEIPERYLSFSYDLKTSFYNRES